MLFDYKKYEEAFPRKQEPQPKQTPAKSQPIGNALEEAEEKPANDQAPVDPEPAENEGGEGDGTE